MLSLAAGTFKREASNEQQDQPPAPPGVGKGNSLIWSTTGKRRKPHKPWSSGLTGPNKERSQEGSCDPWAHHGATAVFGYGTGIQEFLTLDPKEN